MKGIWLYTILILTLFLATSLLLLFLNLSSSFGNLIGVRVFVFSVFGTAICTLFGKTSPLSEDELDGVVQFFKYFVLEDDNELEMEKDYSDYNDDRDSYNGSDGYEEDIDYNGSTTGTDDDDDDDDDYEAESFNDNYEEEKEEEKVDDDLIRRSEEFIRKVKERWRQEMATDRQELAIPDGTTTSIFDLFL